jgi:phosphatidylinositol dimannoside acyltransferase
LASIIEYLINNPVGLKSASFIAQAAPPRLGYGIARFAGWWISSRREAEVVRSVRCNQWIIGGEKDSSQSLDQAAKAVLRNTARQVYELHHYLEKPDAITKLYSFDPSFRVYLDRPEFDQRGLIVAGLHIVGFDLVFLWLCSKVFKPFVLTIPNPEGVSRLEYETRLRAGMNLVPGSRNGLIQAIRYLEQGGMVLTGIDRPMPGSDPQPCFFGQPASLPIHHIFLALKAQVPIVIVASRLEKDGKYHIHASPPIEMDHYPKRSDEMLINAEKVLAVAEVFIQQDPQQWLASLPVWPQRINDVPT